MFTWSIQIIKKIKGFSLMEIIVVIALLAISLVAVITVATKILQVGSVTENDFVAKGLLVEGLELAEAIRNDNVSRSTPFNTGLAAGSMRIDYGENNQAVTSLTDSAARLKYDSTNFYQYSSGADSKFYRRLVIVPKTIVEASTGVDYLEVESQVYWTDRGKGYTQSLSTILYNTTY